MATNTTDMLKTLKYMFLLWNKFGSIHGLYIIKDEYSFYLEVVWG